MSTVYSCTKGIPAAQGGLRATRLVLVRCSHLHVWSLMNLIRFISCRRRSNGRRLCKLPHQMLLYVYLPFNCEQFGFLANLVKVFPSLSTRPLYLTGESYAGTYIVRRKSALFAARLTTLHSRTSQRLILACRTLRLNLPRLPSETGLLAAWSNSSSCRS